ncbi:hypothetical protein TNCT_80021 [Trichonephila clavata]|uniref:Uncharacterized protein n=1 Tax=Trichonephila clavata TaxID=2740835 RepID=A0A8X6GB50_TRICU|nr:hypothetical protein TNCT_80021 [Trichonephila clavata]
MLKREKNNSTHGVASSTRIQLPASTYRLAVRKDYDIADCSLFPALSSPPSGTSSFRIRCPSIIAVKIFRRSDWVYVKQDSARIRTKQPTDEAFLPSTTNSEKMAAVTSRWNTYTDGLSLLAKGFGNWLQALNYARARQKIAARSRNFLKSRK